MTKSENKILRTEMFPDFGNIVTMCKSKKRWLDNSLNDEERLELLLKEMTLVEKIGQLTQMLYNEDGNDNNDAAWQQKTNLTPGSILYFGENPVERNAIQEYIVTNSRLGIPLIFGYDVIHGYKTITPVPLAQAATFNRDLIKQICSDAAYEARYAGIDWTFAPMVDVSTNPRWGRIVECYGEDPYVNAEFAVASVKGFQGENAQELRSDNHLAACMKHYIGYSASEGGRDYQYTEIPRQKLFEEYLVPFRAAVAEANVSTFMCSFNDINGVPATANHFTLTEILRDELNFDGFVVSDWEGVHQLINQGYAKDEAEATMQAINAGTDMNMIDFCYERHLEKLILDNKVSISTLDEAVRRILRIKFRIGLFDSPYVPIKDDSERLLQKEAIANSYQTAVESLVLLKNSESFLPLKDLKSKKIALIGPMPDSAIDMMGSWSCCGDAKDVSTLKIALESVNYDVEFIEGCNLFDDKDDDFANAIKLAKDSDIVIFCGGESASWSGENRSRAGIFVPGSQNELIEKLAEVNKNIVSIIFAGRPLELGIFKKYSSALLLAWFPGMCAGDAIRDILIGSEVPSGKLPITIPEYVGQIPIHYRRRVSSRPEQGKYLDCSDEALFNFGDGLSYTSFKYSNLKLNHYEVTKNDKLTATVDVTNTGDIDGKETALWFISDRVATICRPEKELKYFDKKLIKAQETVSYSFEIDPVKVFGYYDDNGKIIYDQGEIILQVGDQKVTINCK